MPKKIAIIPARGGSKRIPRKNIKDFSGKPIIAYSIEAALQSNLFDEVMVSTDDIEIAEIAKKYGASVPFLRSKDTATDYATTAEVLKEVLERYSVAFDYACCIYATSPFVAPLFLKQAYDKLINLKLDSVFPIVPYSYPIQRSLKIDGDNVVMVWPEHIASRSQDLEKRYHDAGQFYFFSVSAFRKNQKIFTDNTGFIEVNELFVQDIDTENDWELAALKYAYLQKYK